MRCTSLLAVAAAFAASGAPHTAGASSATTPRAPTTATTPPPATGAAPTAILPTSPERSGDPPEWSQPIAPFRIAGNIYYVGTKGLSSYLIVSRAGAILIDPTTAANVPLIEHNIQQVGVQLNQVKLLIGDHAHDDHVGGMADMKRDTGARVLASAGDRQALEQGTPRGDTNYGVRHFAPVTVDEIVTDGQTVKLGEVALTAHLTPGHTPGCTSWSMTLNDTDNPLDVLFLCSITVAGNLLVGNHAYPGIVTDFRHTFDKLAAMRADIVLTSHPEIAAVLAKEAAEANGEKDAFVDPALLPEIVAESRKDFEAKLKAAQSALAPTP